MNALAIIPTNRAQHLRRAIAVQLDEALISQPDGRHLSVVGMDTLVERIAQVAENVAAIPDGPNYRENAIAAGKAYLATLLGESTL